MIDEAKMDDERPAPGARVLFVEDDEDIRELVRYNLGKEGFEVSLAETGEQALEMLEADLPDLVLLDLMLPGIDGLEICRRLKRDGRTANLPVVMLTARGEESDIVKGLELGADDYITKPFRTKVLTARVRAVLRRRLRPVAGDGDAVYVHELSILPERHEVSLAGDLIELTATEFSILLHLARHIGCVFTRQQIVKSVHGDDYPVTGRSVDVQIVSLRKKLGAAGKYIETVRGVGYRFAQ